MVDEINEQFRDLDEAFRDLRKAHNAARGALKSGNSDGNIEETSEWIDYNAASAAYYKAYDDYVENRDKDND